MPDTPASLLSALLAFQADAPHIPLDATNPHFRSKFASLPSIMKIVGPKLAEHGLVWTAKPSQDGNGRPTLKYKLGHASSGESEEDEMPLLLTKQDPQSLGSAITYARRYALLSVLGLVGDEDDDGNTASVPQKAPQRVRYVPGTTTRQTDVPAPPVPREVIEEVSGEIVVPITVDKDAADALLEDMHARKMTRGTIRRFLEGAGVTDHEDVEKAVRGLSIDQWSQVSKAIAVVSKEVAA